ncbi:hypothetical protein HC028_18480 [Planosporangium flavigriseum]|uniref:Uncharacterized protein n=1 Tax=Planosporangium flavigriseum TaxID=373681 RepID=A0A8J3PNT8_9ACTN|nr:hypothetical protein [Planosporangium flavigriseum]NJC66475.1 hypothetical protein [Planosporangium flavigriseum]GIG76352.1 hypothetical protein Pfl04_47560 [Planosporangium flavigriseum]
MRRIANGNEVTLETFETFATVKIETPNGLYEAQFAASELEAVIQLWGLLYGYPPALRPMTPCGR